MNPIGWLGTGTRPPDEPPGKKVHARVKGKVTKSALNQRQHRILKAIQGQVTITQAPLEELAEIQIRLGDA